MRHTTTAVIHILLLSFCFLCFSCADDELTASCTSYLLRTLYPWLDASYQTSLVNDLWACTRLMPINVGAVDLTGLPVVHSIRPIEPDEGAMPYVDPLDDEAPPSEEEHDEDADPTEVENETAVGTCARLRRAEAAASGDVFLARPDEAKGKQPTRQVGNTRTDDTPTATADSKVRNLAHSHSSVLSSIPSLLFSCLYQAPLCLGRVSECGGGPLESTVGAASATTREPGHLRRAIRRIRRRMHTPARDTPPPHRARRRAARDRHTQHTRRCRARIQPRVRAQMRRTWTSHPTRICQHAPRVETHRTRKRAER